LLNAFMMKVMAVLCDCAKLARYWSTRENLPT